jgi:hypothetical protein
MKCSICGKEKELVYKSIYLKNGACKDCQKSYNLIVNHMSKAMPVVHEKEGVRVCKLDAFNKPIQERIYKNSAYKAYVQKYTSKIMGTYVD